MPFLNSRFKLRKLRTGPIGSIGAYGRRSGKPTSRSQLVGGEDLPQWKIVARDLEEQISLGVLVAGDRLMTEASIASHHKVARQTVRTAIAELSRKGLVRCTPGLGAFVSSPKIVYSLANDTRFHENILRAGRRPGSLILTIRETIAPAEVASWLGLARRSKVIEIEHVGTANDVPVCLSTSWVPAERCARVPEFFKRTGSFAEAFRLIGIPRTSRKMSRVTVTRAAIRDREYLDVGVGDTMLVIAAVYADPAGEPVQATHATFPSELVEVVVSP